MRTARNGRSKGKSLNHGQQTFKLPPMSAEGEVMKPPQEPAHLTPEQARQLHAEGLAAEREVRAMYAKMKVLSEEQMRLRTR